MTIRTKLLVLIFLIFAVLLVNLFTLGYLGRTTLVAFNTINDTNDQMATAISMQAEIRSAEAALYRYLIEGEQGFANQFTSHFEAFGQELGEYQAAARSSEDLAVVNQLFEVYQEANELGNTLLSLHDEQELKLELLITQQTELTTFLGVAIADPVTDDPIFLEALNEIPLFATTTLPVLVKYLAFDAYQIGPAAATSTIMVILMVSIASIYFKWIVMLKKGWDNQNLPTRSATLLPKITHISPHQIIS